MNFRYTVTISLISLNVLAFAVLAWQQQSMMMNTTADVQAILQAGANLNPFTLGGQWWRILTAAFLHFGIIHLAVNMYALWQLGSLLEPAIGHSRFTMLYMICALVASIASLIFNVYVISAGASGAIFGLYGYQLGAELISTYKDREKLMKVLGNFAIFVVVNAFIAGQVRVDMSGHIGGAVAGLIVAFSHFKLSLFKAPTAMAVVLVVLPFTLFFVSRDQLRYYNIYQRVVKQEKYTNSLYSEVKGDQPLSDSLQKAQKGWEDIYRDLRALPDVPSQVMEDTATLGRYIALRTQEIKYRNRVLQQSYIYMDSLETLSVKFDSLPKLQKNLNFFPGTMGDVQQDTTAQQPEQQGEQPLLRQVQVFYDKDWKEISDEDPAVYYRIGRQDSLDRWQGPIRDHFKNGDIQMKGSYQNSLRHGVFIYYTDRGTYTSAGRYDKGRSVGKWEFFHWNGKLKSESFHGDRFFTKTILDSLGNEQVSNGNGEYKEWYPNGAIAEEGTYSGGSLTGYQLGYHKNGKPYYRELYREGRLVSGMSEGMDGRNYVYDVSSLFPFPVSGLPKFRAYVEKNRRSCEAGRDGGTVKVLFNVGVDGSLWDFVILEGLSPACDVEAIRLIKEGPLWRAAILHGDTKVVSQGFAEIKF